ncbi:MAG: glycosyltransferase family 1 protein [Verrucomicrobia bacterium]|nr:glycosyltransferase family 1 protein [Verrucomicrobiota bacterium]
MKTFFCLTKEYVPPGQWVQDLIAGKPVEVPAGGGRCLSINWIYQTWALLISSGTPCYAILDTPAADGIVIALSVSASRALKMPDAPFFVDVVADDAPHPAAHFHIVQNKAYAQRLPNAVFMPHWSQPGLVPRDPARGDRFENLCFYGHTKNLALELQAPQWRQRLQEELGIQLHLPSAEQWHDYSQTDCVIAIRDFSHSPHWNKPATKLYNAWLAGIPFIGGRDSAYAADGKPGVDYLVAQSPEEVFEQLRHLKENFSFRSQLVANASLSAKEFTREAILKRWKKLVEETIPERALEWEQKTKRQRSFFAKRQKTHLFLESHSWSHLFKRPTLSPLEINFIIPQETYPSASWIEAWEEGKVVSLAETGKCITSYSWIYQTWSLLKKSGCNFFLIPQLPTSDVAIFLSLSLKSGCKKFLKPNLFLVDIVAHTYPHPAAQFHLVHNKAHARWLPRSFFIPHWPQPHLIPRNPDRGDRFEKICFLGDPEQLALEFISSSWKERLKNELQLEFQIKPVHEWHDYSDVDAVIAIRDFSSARYLDKPATKLYNAWHAGVPFIGGIDSAYATDGRPGIDYLVASSLEETFQHLRRLKENPSLRHELVLHGTESGKAFTREATLLRWQTFLLEKLPTLVEQWQKKSLFERHFFMMTQRFFCFLDRYFR